MKAFAAVLFAPLLIVLPVILSRGWGAVPLMELSVVAIFFAVLIWGANRRA